MTESPSILLPFGRVRAVPIALVVGALAGLLARALFNVLPDPWDTLANTSALWGLVPFAIVLILRLRGWFAVVIGIASLAAMVTLWVVLSPTAGSTREVAMWAAAAVVAGGFCGLAGSGIRHRGHWQRRASLAFIGGIIAGEGLYGIIVIGGPQWWLELGFGLLLPLISARLWRDRMLGLAGAVVIACALFAAYLIYDAIAVA